MKQQDQKKNQNPIDLSNGELISFFENKLIDLETKIEKYEKDILAPDPKEMNLMRGVCIEMVKTLDIYKLKRCVDFMWGIGETPEMIQLHMIAGDHKKYTDKMTKRICRYLPQGALRVSKRISRIIKK